MYSITRSTTTISLKSYLKFMGQWHNECKVMEMLNIRPETLTIVKVRISELASMRLFYRYSLWVDEVMREYVDVECDTYEYHRDRPRFEMESDSLAITKLISNYHRGKKCA